MRSLRSASNVRRGLVVAGVAAAATILIYAAASPAAGGLTLRKLSRSVTHALKLAKSADARSKRALRAARPGPSGPPGPPGISGISGGARPVGGAAGGATVLDFRADPGTSRAIYDRGGLLITAICSAGPAIQVVAQTRVDHAILHASIVSQAPPAPAVTTLLQKNDFLIAGAPQSLASGHVAGTATYSTPAGIVTTLTYGAEQGAFGGADAKGCWFGGTAETNG